MRPQQKNLLQSLIFDDIEMKLCTNWDASEGSSKDDFYELLFFCDLLTQVTQLLSLVWQT